MGKAQIKKSAKARKLKHRLKTQAAVKVKASDVFPSNEVKTTPTRSTGDKLVADLIRQKSEKKADEAVRRVVSSFSSSSNPNDLGIALVHCASRGLENSVRMLLTAKVSPNQLDAALPEGRQTALQLACAKGHVGVVRALLQAGADRSGAMEACRELALLGAVYAAEKNEIQGLLTA